MQRHSFLLIASTVCLAACQPSPGNSGATSPSMEAITTAPTAPPIPKPVRHFEDLCYRTEANYERVSSVAKAMDLKEAPEKLQALLSSGQGGAGDSYVIELDHDAAQVMILGVGKNGTCAIYAAGYSADVVESSVREHFRLLQVASDDVGLQVFTMNVPDGKSNLISEAHEKGIVGILRAKPGSMGSEDEVILSYIPPELARSAL